tara:strand:- start:47 stop:613 length:567 start_codon:yes stop_codon:yes gene_type:complete
MSNAISQEIIETTTDGVKAIAMSLATQDQLTELSEFKKNLDKNTSRDNYCKTALLLWGVLSFQLDEVDDSMFNRVLLMSLGVLNKVLSRSEFEPYFNGVDLSPNPEGGDHSNLSYEMHSWFKRNDSHPGVQVLITTGKHLFGLLVLKDQLKEDQVKKLYEMGSLLQENTNGMGVMKSILMDNNIKFNF